MHDAETNRSAFLSLHKREHRSLGRRQNLDTLVIILELSICLARLGAAEWHGVALMLRHRRRDGRGADVVNERVPPRNGVVSVAAGVFDGGVERPDQLLRVRAAAGTPLGGRDGVDCGGWVVELPVESEERRIGQSGEASTLTTTN